MSTTKSKKEIKRQARMDSLNQKTREQLIEIILKKDNTERKNCDKIANLHQEIRDLQIVVKSKNIAVEDHNTVIKQVIDEMELDETNFRERKDLYEKEIAALKTHITSNEKLVRNAKRYRKLFYALLVSWVIYIVLHFLQGGF